MFDDNYDDDFFAPTQQVKKDEPPPKIEMFGSLDNDNFDDNYDDEKRSAASKRGGVKTVTQPNMPSKKPAADRFDYLNFKDNSPSASPRSNSGAGYDPLGIAKKADVRPNRFAPLEPPKLPAVSA